MLSLPKELSNLYEFNCRKIKRTKSAKYLEQQLLYAIENNCSKYLTDEGWYQMFVLIDFDNAWNCHTGEITLRINVCQENAYLYSDVHNPKLWKMLSPFAHEHELLYLDSKDVLWALLNYDNILKLVYNRLNYLMDYSEELLALPSDHKKHWIEPYSYTPPKIKVVTDTTYDCSCNLLPKYTSLNLEILAFWGGKYLEHCKDEHNIPYVILYNSKPFSTADFLLVDVSIEETPKILSATRLISPSEFRDISQAIKYISRNKDILLKYFNNSHSSKGKKIFCDEDLFKTLEEKGEYKVIK